MILKNKTARNRSKGVTAISTIAALFLIVGVLVFVYVLLLKIPKLGDDIFALLDKLIGGGFGGIGDGYGRLTDAIRLF